MRSIKSIVLCSIAAAVLVACGGGGNGDQSPKVTYTSMVSFGDSLSDVGTYAVSGIAAAGGGKYTVNSATAKNWTELIAAQLGLPAPCAAETGLNGSAFNAPTTPHPGCFNYAQGGARVTLPYGPGNAALDNGTNGYAALGQLTVPVVNQIANHFTAIGRTTFSGTELITVAAGANDVFIQLGAMGTVGTSGFAAYAGGVAGWTGAQITAVNTALGIPDVAGATAAAASAAVTAMGTAGAQLAALINTQMVAKGATHIVVSNMPDVSKTPFVQGLSVDTQNLVNTMVTTFNAQLQTGLAGSAGVTIVDAYTSNRDQTANPSQYALTNVTTPACEAAGNILAGNSLTCTTSNTLSAGSVDVSHYLFADSVHPTPFGYKLFAQLVTNKMIAAGWL